MSDSIRKLAVIVFTDIVDFTRLSADNEPAIEIGEKMSSVKSYWELFPITYANGFYIKGLAYEGLGRTSDAIQEFETLSFHWKNSDLKIPMLLDSKKRLITLKKHPDVH
jgi:hypothetical protein